MILQYEPVFDNSNLALDMLTYFNNNGWITEHTKTREFEKEIASLTNSKYCWMMSNGTISLSLALLASGIKPGDEVIVPALTMVATPNAVKLIGAIPVFVDVDKENLCMSFSDVLNKVSEKTKALIYVTLNGRSHKFLDFSRWCKEHNIAYIEDDAQSLGSKFSDGSTIGSRAEISSFSFSMPKIITTGQGGCLCTNSDSISNNIKQLRDFGRIKSGIDEYPTFGINAKFTDIQSIVGLSQLKNIHSRIERKKEIYSQYHFHLKDVEEIEFINTDLNYVTPWFADIYVKNRNKLISHLLNYEGIGTRPIYPSLPKEGCYNLHYKFPISEEYSVKGLWLPSSLNLEDCTIKFVCDKIKKYFLK